MFFNNHELKDKFYKTILFPLYGLIQLVDFWKLFFEKNLEEAFCIFISFPIKNDLSYFKYLIQNINPDFKKIIFYLKNNKNLNEKTKEDFIEKMTSSLKNIFFKLEGISEFIKKIFDNEEINEIETIIKNKKTSVKEIIDLIKEKLINNIININ